MSYSRDDLLHLVPTQPTLVGIDSDGCVFDSMEVKQKECFHPEILQSWGLDGIEIALRETAEFINLYSEMRGLNRFIALLRTFELLGSHPKADGAGVSLPPTESLRTFVESGAPLTNGSLHHAADSSGDPELRRILEWSTRIDKRVQERVTDIHLFPWVRQALEKMSTTSDLMICSQTPVETLEREWAKQEINGYIQITAGQEFGTKTEQLSMGWNGKYAPGKVLMIGDAPGDLIAAREAKTLFYPIIPGAEGPSWKRLVEEAYESFLAGTYAGEFECRLIGEFKASLPEAPYWLDTKSIT